MNEPEVLEHIEAQRGAVRSGIDVRLDRGFHACVNHPEREAAFVVAGEHLCAACLKAKCEQVSP